MNQTFTLEIRKTNGINSKGTVKSKESNTPEFNVRYLEIGVEYLLTITAKNVRGRSTPVTLTYTPTLTEASPLLHEGSMFEELWMLLALVVGILLVATILVLISFLLVKSSCFSPSHRRPMRDAVKLSQSDSSFYDPCEYLKKILRL